MVESSNSGVRDPMADAGKGGLGNITKMMFEFVSQSCERYQYTAAIAIVVIAFGLLVLQVRGSKSSASVLRGKGRITSSRSTTNTNGVQKLKAFQNPNLFVFPPSTSKRLGISRANAANTSEDERVAELQENQMPADVSPFQCQASMRTPTDMTIEEIQAVGDFPDYAELTGIPHPKPYQDFDIKTARARPYRPLRWNYVQNMSLMKLEPDWWLEVTSDYKTLLKWRQEILAEHGRKVLDWRPGTELAAKEIMEMALQFYTKRYPMHFELCQRAGDGWVFVNRILETETVIKDHHPLKILFDNIPEEFMLAVRNSADGLYYCRGGVCCSSVGWSMAQKMDKPLEGVHGPVPDYKKNMAFSMDRFFAKMSCDRPIQRGSWELKIGRLLFAPPPAPGAPVRAKDYSKSAIEDVIFRVDWQTLRRLPLSGAIVFNFRCLFTPLPEFRDEKYMPALFHKVLTESKESMLSYKSTADLDHLSLPNLRKWMTEQEDAGMVEPDWEVRTLDESPFFSGWQDKWKRKDQTSTAASQQILVM